MRGLLVLPAIAVAAAFAGTASARHAESDNPFKTGTARTAIIHFVPLDGRASRLMASVLPTVKPWLTSRHQTEITDVPTPRAAWENTERHQLDAQIVMRDLLGRWRQANGSRTAFVVAVTSDSAYDTRTPTYRFVFGTYSKWDSRTQVANIVATAQMRVFHPDRQKARMTKMILRYIGVRLCRLRYNNDPRSVLYSQILSDADLDRMVARLPRRC